MRGHRAPHGRAAPARPVPLGGPTQATPALLRTQEPRRPRLGGQAGSPPPPVSALPEPRPGREDGAEAWPSGCLVLCSLPISPAAWTPWPAEAGCGGERDTREAPGPHDTSITCFPRNRRENAGQTFLEVSEVWPSEKLVPRSDSQGGGSQVGAPVREDRELAEGPEGRPAHGHTGETPRPGSRGSS